MLSLSMIVLYPPLHLDARDSVTPRILPTVRVVNPTDLLTSLRSGTQNSATRGQGQTSCPAVLSGLRSRRRPATLYILLGQARRTPLLVQSHALSLRYSSVPEGSCLAA